MASSTLIVLLSYALLTLTLTSAQRCYNTGNFTADSAYAQNRNIILSSLASHASSSDGFYSSAIGRDSEIVYALALCRGDLSPEVCFNCVNSSSHEITVGCPNQKEAVGWANNNHRCIVRVSDKSLLGVMESQPAMFVYITANITTYHDADEFDQALDDLVGHLVARAATSSSGLKFATGHTRLDRINNLYVLMQCTPNLLSTECMNCLSSAFAEYQSCCRMKLAVNILRPSCIFQYALDQFYESTAYDAPLPPPTPVPTRPLPPPPTPGSGQDNNTTRIVITAAVPSVIFFVLIAGIFIFVIKWKQRKPKGEFDSLDEISSVESLQYEFGVLKAATDDFSNTNKLGKGGFGVVYKGRLPNGTEIAVKRLSMDSRQGETEFKNEVLLMAKLQHRNLVRLLGFCFEGTERLLIYEFMPNASLDHFIFDPIKRADLNWHKRYKIIEGIARGLTYLHEDSRLRIVHRDLKASNVLLGGEMNPKIADFGMAKLFVPDETQGDTNRIVGTYGYMAPEYAMHGKFSVKSDVFSFGVLVLEIVSGQKTNSFRIGEALNLLKFAWENWEEGTAQNMIDPTLGDDSGSMEEIMGCIHVGMLCVQENVEKRPTMASVVQMLNSFSKTLPLPSPSPSPSPFENPLPECFSVNVASITDLVPR